jgi:hypothetical protein
VPDARVVLGGRDLDPAALAKCAQDTAHIAGIDAERLLEHGGAGPVLVAKLPEQAHLAQAEGAAEDRLVEHADAAGVELVEVADGRYAVLEDFGGQWPRAEMVPGAAPQGWGPAPAIRLT